MAGKNRLLTPLRQDNPKEPKDQLKGRKSYNQHQLTVNEYSNNFQGNGLDNIMER